MTNLFSDWQPCGLMFSDSQAHSLSPYLRSTARIAKILYVLVSLGGAHMAVNAVEMLVLRHVEGLRMRVPLSSPQWS